MDKSNMTFQVFAAAEPINPNGKDPNSKSFNSKQKPKAMNQTNDTPALYPTSAGVQANESPQNNCGNDNAMYPIEVQQAQQAKDKANDFQENLPKYKKICDKVYEAADVENNAAEVEPMLPPVIS